MKRIILSTLTVLALTTTGALVAQSPQNTGVPGPTQQLEPGLTNNNLPNPGNPQTNLERRTQPVQSGEVEMSQSTTGIAPETEQGTGMDVDVDTGARANGAVDVDVTRTTDADTDASGINETGESTTGAYNDTDTLPATASNVPAVGLIGLLAFGAAFAVRTLRRKA